MMQTLTDINIRMAIAHRVAPNKQGVFHLSPDPFEISDPSVEQFLVGHITRGLRRGRTATFKHPAPTGHKVAEWCSQAATGRQPTFVARSRRIATAMNDVVKENASISDAVLAVVSFTATTPDDEREPFLALLKLDPGKGFVPERLDDGTLQIKVGPNVLPSTREGLQKCAFVTPDVEADRQLVVLDVQAPGDDVRDWFLDSFLAAELGDEIKMTRELNVALHEARGELEDELDEEAKERWHAKVTGVWAGETADVEHFITELKLTKPRAQVVRKKISERMVDPVFPIDRRTANRFLRSSRYRADNSVEVKGPPGAFGTTVKWVKDTDSEFTIVTIRTKQWELA